MQEQKALIVNEGNHTKTILHNEIANLKLENDQLYRKISELSLTVKIIKIHFFIFYFFFIFNC